MIFSTAADAFKLPISIAARIRLVFFLFGLISLATFAVNYTSPSEAVDFEWVYNILLPVGAASCFTMVVRPTIGSGSLFLLPLFVGSAVRIVDFWLNYFEGDIPLEVATRCSVGWSFLLVSIAYVDLLESHIYHRMVNYIEQEVD